MQKLLLENYLLGFSGGVILEVVVYMDVPMGVLSLVPVVVTRGFNPLVDHCFAQIFGFLGGNFDEEPPPMPSIHPYYNIRALESPFFKVVS